MIELRCLPLRFLRLLRRAVCDRRGVAAAEFALLAPVLFGCYFLSMEFSQSIEVSKKVDRVASMVGDLITQQPEITSGEVKAIMQIGEALLQPYNRSPVMITVTAIQMSDDPAPKARVLWSRRLQNGNLTATPPFAKNTVVTVPEKLLTRNGFLMRVESSLPYRTVLTWTAGSRENLGIVGNALDPIDMGETYYLRPRQSDTIPCTDC